MRSSRWRRGFVAACLPYLLLSVFVDFLHVHPAWGRAGLHVQVAGAPSTLTVPAVTVRPAAGLFLRSLPMAPDGHPAAGVGDGCYRARDAPGGRARQRRPNAPESPVPHPPAFRGPPRPFFA